MQSLWEGRADPKMLPVSWADSILTVGIMFFQRGTVGPYTGCAIKNWSHTFNHTCSNDRNPSNFKTNFICYYTELSYDVYNSSLGQLA